jgi:hypothetical protein
MLEWDVLMRGWDVVLRAHRPLRRVRRPVVVSVAASLIPGLRATRVDPVAALETE